MAERVLMIDDDRRLAEMVSDYLGGAGFRLTLALTARDLAVDRDELACLTQILI
jgi:DNA-binding response OmpR family regulator